MGLQLVWFYSETYNKNGKNVKLIDINATYKSDITNKRK